MKNFYMFCLIGIVLLGASPCLSAKTVVVPLNLGSRFIEGSVVELSISGNGVRKFHDSDSTIIDMGTTGDAQITRGGDAGIKNVMLPISYHVYSYGRRAKITEFAMFFNCETASDYISAILLRRQTGVCIGDDTGCYDTIFYDGIDRSCTSAKGCQIGWNVSDDGYLDSSYGQLYLTISLSFSSSTSVIAIGGVRLTITYE